jgi:hypothetical protein
MTADTDQLRFARRRLINGILAARDIRLFGAGCAIFNDPCVTTVLITAVNAFSTKISRAAPR